MIENQPKIKFLNKLYKYPNSLVRKDIQEQKAEKVKRIVG